MAGGLWAQKIQIGKETTAGTAVAATTIWRGEGETIKDDRTVEFVSERLGIAIPTTRNFTPKLGASLPMAPTPATFEQLPYIFEAGIKAVDASPSAEGSGFLYSYDVGLTSVNTINYYTLEAGDNQQAEEMEYGFVTDFTLTGNAGEAVMMSANWMGRQSTNVSFTGALTVPAVEEILAGKGLFYIDANTGTHGTTQVSSTLLSWELSVTTGWRPKFTVDSGQLYFDFSYFDKSSFEAMLNVVYEHNSTAVTEKNTNWRNNTPRLIRLDIEGSALTTAGSTYDSKTLRIDLTGAYESFEALGEQDGNSVLEASFRIGYDPTDATGLTAAVVNNLSSLP